MFLTKARLIKFSENTKWVHFVTKGKQVLQYKIIDARVVSKYDTFS